MQENFELVQKGFRILVSSMSGYIGQELNKIYKNVWWNEVLPHYMTREICHLQEPMESYWTLLILLTVFVCWIENGMMCLEICCHKIVVPGLKS